MYFVARFLLILLMAHNISTGWLDATLKSLLLETFEVVFLMYLISIIWVKIHEHRARKRKEHDAE